LRLEDLKRAPHGVSVYIVLPARFMKTHSRWMRLILNLTVSRLERDPGPPFGGHPVLAILDEFATLGHMPVLEAAVGYMASFGLKLWAVLQDLPQLKRHYPASWETFLGNAGLLQVFGNADQTTLDYVSKRLGELEVIREVSNRNETLTETVSDMSDFDKAKRSQGRSVMSGVAAGFGLANETLSRSEAKATSDHINQNIQKAPLMTPDEIRLYFARETNLQIVALSDKRPIFLWRSKYFDDPYFRGKFRARGD
jgi:type IV secretion system protein VirD4